MEAAGFRVDDWLKSIGGVAFFIAGVLPWWKEEFDTGLSQMFNAFDYSVTGLIPYIIFVAIALLTIIIRTESLRLPMILIDPLLTLVAASVGTVLVGIRFFMDGYGDLAPGQNVSRGMGLYLAAASALVVLAGSVLAYRDHDRLVESDDDDDDIDVESDPVYRPRRQAQHPPLP